ncbi:AAA family ATPase, partial [Planctomycetota bacterium]
IIFLDEIDKICSQEGVGHGSLATVCVAASRRPRKQGVEQMGFDFQNLFERLVPRKRQERRMSVEEARRLLQREESEKMIDRDKLHREALRLAETSGIIFLDEIDKIRSLGLHA